MSLRGQRKDSSVEKSLVLGVLTFQVKQKSSYLYTVGTLNDSAKGMSVVMFVVDSLKKRLLRIDSE